MRNFLLTRMDDKNQTDREKRFSEVEAQFISLPLIEVVSSFEWTDERLTELKQTQWLLFSSQYGVRAFFETAKQSHKWSEIKTIMGVKKIACVGKYTALALQKEGFETSFVPSVANIDTLIEEWMNHSEWRCDHGIWVNGDQLTHRFDMDPSRFIDWELYRNQCPIDAPIQLKELLQQVTITDYFVSSPSIWRRFYEVAKSFPAISHIHFYVLGKKTAQAILTDLPKVQITFVK